MFGPLPPTSSGSLFGLHSSDLFTSDSTSLRGRVIVSCRLFNDPWTSHLDHLVTVIPKFIYGPLHKFPRTVIPGELLSSSWYALHTSTLSLTHGLLSNRSLGHRSFTIQPSGTNDPPLPLPPALNLGSIEDLQTVMSFISYWFSFGVYSGWFIFLRRQR